MDGANPRPGRLPPGGPAFPFRMPAAATGHVSAGVAGFLLAAALAACAPSRPGYPSAAPAAPAAETPGSLPAYAPEAADSAAAAGAPRFQLVYLIHGDADYIWHDSSGTRRLADQDAVAQARRLAAASPAAEVLIFHQTPRRQRWAHPSRDGVLWHYRGGRLIRRRDYSRAGSGGNLRAETALFLRHAAVPAAPGARMLFWFGHEIPLRPLPGYSRSLPREAFAMSDLVRALARMGGPAGAKPRPFSLVALSSCRGGSPAATSALFPYADFVIASPTELHLSHLDTRPLAPLLARPAAFGWDALKAGAEGMARASFAALSARTGTAVTLAVYESERAAAWLSARAAVPAVAAAGPAAVPAPAAWADCAGLPGFGKGGAEAGALVLHRPARFGRRKGEAGHSGWECRAPSAATAQAPKP